MNWGRIFTHHDERAKSLELNYVVSEIYAKNDKRNWWSFSAWASCRRVRRKLLLCFAAVRRMTFFIVVTFRNYFMIMWILLTRTFQFRSMFMRRQNYAECLSDVLVSEIGGGRRRKGELVLIGLQICRNAIIIIWWRIWQPKKKADAITSSRTDISQFNVTMTCNLLSISSVRTEINSNLIRICQKKNIKLRKVTKRRWFPTISNTGKRKGFINFALIRPLGMIIKF